MKTRTGIGKKWIPTFQQISVKFFLSNVIKYLNISKRTEEMLEYISVEIVDHQP